MSMLPSVVDADRHLIAHEFLQLLLLFVPYLLLADHLDHAVLVLVRVTRASLDKGVAVGLSVE